MCSSWSAASSWIETDSATSRGSASPASAARETGFAFSFALIRERGSYHAAARPGTLGADPRNPPRAQRLHHGEESEHMASGSSEMIVTLPGGKRVDTQIGRHVIRTDQPVEGGGEDSAPPPFGLFLAAIGTCAGIYVAGFCQKRGLPTEGIRLRQRNHFDRETGALTRVEIDVEVP